MFQITPINNYWGRPYKYDCVAVKNFYNGTAKLRVHLDNSKLGAEKGPFVYLQTRSESSTRCRISRTSASSDLLKFIVFNRYVQLLIKLLWLLSQSVYNCKGVNNLPLLHKIWCTTSEMRNWCCNVYLVCIKGDLAPSYFQRLKVGRTMWLDMHSWRPEWLVNHYTRWKCKSRAPRNRKNTMKG